MTFRQGKGVRTWQRLTTHEHVRLLRRHESTPFRS